MVFIVSDRLGDVVAKFPGAGKVFKENRIDYCCNGGRSVEEAATAQNLDVNALLQTLNQSYEKAVAEGEKEHDWQTEAFEALIDHVVNIHHAYLQKTMPVLSELTSKILRVHGQHHGAELSKVHKLFNTFRMDMEAHLIKEEELVFPLIIEYERTGNKDKLALAVQNIDQLESEHAAVGDILHEIAEVTNEYQIPEDACGTYAYTYEKLEQVEEDTFRHVHLENNILFPRLRAILEPVRA